MSVTLRTIRTELWCVVYVVMALVVEAAGLNGDHVCMVQQKYNITKRVKYRAPMSVRTYEWCFSMPPRCSKWSTEMRDLTRLETEERTAEVAVCCPGYKMRDVSCVPICPPGKTGSGCSEECPTGKWGPNCVRDCKRCSEHGSCSPVTGRCRCQEGWQGERCEMSMSTPSPVEELTITKPVTKSTSIPENESITLTSIKATTATTERTLTTTKNVPPTTIAPITIMSTTSIASTTSTRAIPITATTTTIPKPIVSSTTIKTTTPTTPMTSTTVAVETTIPSIKVATVGAKKEDSTQYKSSTVSNFNATLSTPWTWSTYDFMTTRQPATTNSVLRTTIATTTESERFTTAPPTTPTAYKMPTIIPSELRTDTTSTEILTATPRTVKETLITDLAKEVTRKPETTTKLHPTTAKFKPKEIWIRPAQKGELPIDTKIKPNLELPKYKSATKKDITTVTTPRTIIVSIIPTSISYATFKKMALTTSSYLPHRNVTGKPTESFTRSMSPSTPSPVKKPSTKTTTIFQSTTFKPRTFKESKANATNSMSTSTTKPNSSLTISSTNAPKPWTYETPSTKTLISLTSKPVKRNATEKPKQALIGINGTVIKESKSIGESNDTKKITNTITEEPESEETFHILTEPEHITAVMGDKGAERASVDLISVMGIAGGVMITVITVAVVIVMLERCKRPRYEEAKMNNISMQVMIDNNDGPPPYVRSIFNTPLPEPPSAEKCHYQPISTLDRNLKQFMRPVVVQTISPMMLENFRGILECHYDHLPRRSIEFQTLPARHSLAPSLGDFSEPRQQRPDSLAESTIEALKCEAKLDVIDSTTSEPLYAEIPCWRPPSEHAIEIVNLNGEAVTEL